MHTVNQPEPVCAFEVGTILAYSRGGREIAVSFFEIVSRKGRAVEIRPIAGVFAISIPFTATSAYKVPVPGRYTGGSFWAKIGPYGIVMRHGPAIPTEPTTQHFTSL